MPAFDVKGLLATSTLQSNLLAKSCFDCKNFQRMSRTYFIGTPLHVCTKFGMIYEQKSVVWSSSPGNMWAKKLCNEHRFNPNSFWVTFLSPIAFVITIHDYEPVRYLTDAVSQNYFYCNVCRQLRENGIVTAFDIQLHLPLSTVKSNSNWDISSRCVILPHCIS